MISCHMCGKQLGTGGKWLWFQYDNGEKVRALCCIGCQFKHDALTDADGNRVPNA